jgi:3-oxoacyl-[acyl-carrier protein] reductase
VFKTSISSVDGVKEMDDNGVSSNVRVGNGVRWAPGYIYTDMMAILDQDALDYVKSRISLRRLGTVEGVSPLVCFLLSDKSTYITGQVIQVDGGVTL